jgi:hypothetical protein
MKTIELDYPTRKLLDFTEKCKEKGYVNNSSLSKLRFDWCLDNGGMWYVTIVNDNYISMSGIHEFLDGYRCLYRSVQLESIANVGLNMQSTSYCWTQQLPLQVKYSGLKPMYITTNIGKNTPDHMLKIDKIMKIMKKYSMVQFIKTELINGVQQNLWLLNKDKI